MFLEINNLKKSFGTGESRVEVLKGIQFSVEKGEICVLFGPSGSGKSTLLNIIGGIDEADSGSIVIEGEKIEDMNEKTLTRYRRKHLGYVFQMYNLIPNLTVKENMEVGAYLSDHPLDINDLQDARAAQDAAERAPLPIGVLLSGSGTNLQALIDAIGAGTLNAQIKLVVASRPSAYGLKRAEAAGIQTLTLSKDVYADPIAADEIIAHELLERGCEYVVMAGYMRMVHTPLLAAFPNRVVNLHPALLPSFTGAHAIDDAFARGVKVTGVTVHFANEIYDNGPIIAQRALAVGEGWDVDTLEEHIHAIEHVLYPEVVQMLADGRVHVLESGKVAIDAPRG